MAGLIDLVANQVAKEMKGQPITLSLLVAETVAIVFLVVGKADASDVGQLEQGMRTLIESDVYADANAQKDKLDAKIAAARQEIRELKLRAEERELDGKPPALIYEDRIRVLEDEILQAESEKESVTQKKQDRLKQLQKAWENQDNGNGDMLADIVLPMS